MYYYYPRSANYFPGKYLHCAPGFGVRDDARHDSPAFYLACTVHQGSVCAPFCMCKPTTRSPHQKGDLYLAGIEAAVVSVEAFVESTGEQGTALGGDQDPGTRARQRGRCRVRPE